MVLLPGNEEKDIFSCNKVYFLSNKLCFPPIDYWYWAILIVGVLFSLSNLFNSSSKLSSIKLSLGLNYISLPTLSFIILVTSIDSVFNNFKANSFSA